MPATKQKEINIDIAKSMNSAYFAPYYFEGRWLVLMGGANSGKSVFAGQKNILRIAKERRHKILALRKIAKSCRGSVFSMLLSIINEWGIRDKFKINLSDLSITCLVTKSKIFCMGLDDPEKIKSICSEDGMTGVTSIWLEEPTEFTEEDIDQLDLRMRGRTDNYKQFILSFNPISEHHWLKERFWGKHAPKDMHISHTTYLDNEFAPQEDIDVIESTKERNYSWYRVYGLGEWGQLEGAIYQSPKQLDEFPEEFNQSIYGLDFGFRNPTALVKLGVKDLNPATPAGDVYCEEKIYQSDLTTPELIAKMKGVGVKPDDRIYADSAEPDRIKQIRQAGFDIKPAVKGPGSVSGGIAFVQSMNLYTLATNTNFNSEIAMYAWQEDKEKPIEINDHLMDAMRYGLWSHFARPAPGLIRELDMSVIQAMGRD